MTFQLTRLRAIMLALAIMLAAALVVQAAQPAMSGAAKKTAAAKKKAKAKAKAKKKAAKRKAAKKRKAALKKRMAGLKFYNPPKKIPTAHGKLIWQRKAGGLVPLKSASSTRLVLYTSKSPSGKTVAVSGSVSFPKGKAPKGGWPLITWGHSTTGIADKCAPSRITRNSPVQEGISYIDPVLNDWLKAGYAVARSDFQGLGTPGVHPYIHGVSAGRDMLDMARAARQLGPKVRKQFLIGGHSQGGHAALWAAGLASKWTPELKLRGSAIYAPGSQFKTQADFLPALVNPNPLTALASMLFRGLSVAYPALDAGTMLSDDVLPLYGDTEKECLDRMMEADHLGGIAPSKLFRSDLDKTELNRILDEQNPLVKTAAPVMLLQGDIDDSTLQFLTDTLNTQLTGLGNTVDYKVYNGLDHWSVVTDTRADVLAFLKNRLPSGR